MVKQYHHDNEVDLILDDIRDTLAPGSNPDCTFITRRHDKRLQERLIDLSDREDPKAWSTLVYTRDLEQTAVGWQDIIPYPKYVDKRPVEKGPTKRMRHTNPVDNSTIVRHLQERIRKWADRKPGIYTKKSSYSTASAQKPGFVPATCPAQLSKVALISSVDLPLNPENDQKQSVKKSNSNEGLSPNDSPDKFPVSWNILSQNDATHLNLQTYGMDPNVTYVPARRLNSHINSYTERKKTEQQERTVAKQQQLYGRPGGVLQPARAPRYKSRKPGVRLRRYPDSTEDMTEEGADEESTQGTKFKCSICIEGLQVAAEGSARKLQTQYCSRLAKSAEKLQNQHFSMLPEICRTVSPVLFEPDWPPNIEYHTSDAESALVHSKIQGKNLGGGPLTSDSLVNYKIDKAPVDLGSTTSLALVSGEGRAKRNSPGQLYTGTALRTESVANQDHFLSKGRLLDLKQLVIKERINPSAMRSVRANRKKQDQGGSPHNGRGTEKRPLRKSDKCFRSEGGAQSLYDRFQASKSGKKKRKMYGVSICDVYESKPEPDMFSYGLFLSTPIATPPSKQKLDPLMNIKPVNFINNLSV
ncbi:uncharacterized protein LOC134817764 isoform X3 [Bolinopsis microptera]|uniref:uncharacterized protein LOC134817764 isoform X3 n=1 Tax=Bolinopsis microptera TaxID=2820187 RepID=UPI0030794431